MPRKQRFKPSRKPKPTTIEEASKPAGDQHQARSPITESEGTAQERDDRGLDRVNGSPEERPSV